MSHAVVARPPRGELAPPPLEREPSELVRYLEDAAHFPGGHTSLAAFPRDEGEVAWVLRNHRAVLTIGGQSSLTGGATPDGAAVLSTTRLTTVARSEADRVRVGAGVTFAALRDTLAADGLWMPPSPTFDGATIGGAAATNAAGAATFKYGSVRRWVEALTIVLASGDVLDVRRGEVHASPSGRFVVVGTDPRIATVVPVPAIRMPDVPKCSAGYFARPGMDLIDLFIGSEGTLGVVTELTVRVAPRPAGMWWALVPAPDERRATALVRVLREAAGPELPVAAIEHLDRRCLSLLAEEGRDTALGVTWPPDTAVLLLIQIEQDSPLHEGAGWRLLDDAVAGETTTSIGRFVRILQGAGLDAVSEVAPPHHTRRHRQIVGLREAVPAAVNARVGAAQRAVDAGIYKTAGDLIVPFDRFDELVEACRATCARRRLDVAIWGHISDGNIHPNVIPASLRDVEQGRAAMLELGETAIALGGSPLAEHGVGRHPVKQALLAKMYGARGIEAMRQVKRALDPEWKLAPGVLFAP